MKPRLLILVALAAFAAPCFALDAPIPEDRGPSLIHAAVKFSTQVALDVADLQAATLEPGAVVIVAAGPIELAFLPISPAPAQIEQARCRVPAPPIASGYRIHAWTSPTLHRSHSRPANALALTWRGPRSYDRLA